MPTLTWERFEGTRVLRCTAKYELFGSQLNKTHSSSEVHKNVLKRPRRRRALTGNEIQHNVILFSGFFSVFLFRFTFAGKFRTSFLSGFFSVFLQTSILFSVLRLQLPPEGTLVICKNTENRFMVFFLTLKTGFRCFSELDTRKWRALSNTFSVFYFQRFFVNFFFFQFLVLLHILLPSHPRHIRVKLCSTCTK